MTLKDLIAIAPPPASPVETGGSQMWESIESELGSELPNDFKAIVGAYGTGAFYDDLWVLNPFAANKNLNLIQAGKRIMGGYRTTRSDFPQYAPPYEVFPEPGGILLWGAANHAELYWQTSGSPDDWTCVICDDEYGRIECFNFGVTEFLCRLLGGGLITSVFEPDYFSGGPPFFVPLQS